MGFMTRSLLALAAVGLALLTPSPASGASGSSNGIRVQTAGGGVLVVSFQPWAAKRFGQVRGRRITVRCTRFGRSGALVRDDEAESINVTAPRRRAPIRVRLADRRYDVCEVGRADAPPLATVALTARGRTHVDEQASTRDMLGLIGFASTLSPDGQAWPSAERVAAAVGRAFALASPDATPPAGSLGYFSDGGRRLVVAVLSKAGRRLFIDLDGDVTATNVLEYLDG